MRVVVDLSTAIAYHGIFRSTSGVHYVVMNAKLSGAFGTFLMTL
jgi:hypothetical protein